MTGTWTRAVSTALVLIVAGYGVAFADDDPLAPPPADKGAPPAPTGKEDAKKPELPKVPAETPAKPEAPAKPETPVKPETPAKPAPKDKADGWGTPDASPTKAVATDLLPPPVVRNPATGATTATTARSTPPLSEADTFVDVDPALVPLTPDVTPRTAAPSTGTLKAAAPAGARIRTIAKVHNVRLRDGSSALRLDIEFGASGQQGRSLLLAAGFSRDDTGATIRSLVPAYAGRAGNIVTRTAPVRVQADGFYRASLWVPYGAFPAPPAGGSYNVRALVQLLRQERGGAETVMSHQATTFTVHGPATR